jgi:hypothetical protein
MQTAPTYLGAAVIAASVGQKLVLVVHGIGQQTRNATLQSVSRRFAGYSYPKLATHSLGYFYDRRSAAVELGLPEGAQEYLKSTRFVESFWADIPVQANKRKDTLEEIKAWGKGVVSRAWWRWEQSRVLEAKRGFEPNDFRRAARVVEEIVETVTVLDHLCFLAGRAGLFHFELRQLLEDYVGDVQIVAEFGWFRDRIVGRFQSILAKLHPSATDIYIIAHSEGTVVAFLGLLRAFSNFWTDEKGDKQQGRCPWAEKLRGFMTIGSPIDKHLVLWPEMWTGPGGVMAAPQLQLATEQKDDGRVLFRRSGIAVEPISWFNYYDYGDPVGFKLDAARKWLEQTKRCFAFALRDFGFARYWLPGKAHNDYWADAPLFDHFIDNVVFKDIAIGGGQREEISNVELGKRRFGAQNARAESYVRAAPPRDKTGPRFLSPVVPYLIAFGCFVAAVFLLFKAVLAFAIPDSVQRAQQHSLGQNFRDVICLAWFLAACTVAARLPRLAKSLRTPNYG